MSDVSVQPVGVTETSGECPQTPDECVTRSLLDDVWSLESERLHPDRAVGRRAVRRFGNQRRDLLPPEWQVTFDELRALEQRRHERQVMVERVRVLIRTPEQDRELAIVVARMLETETLRFDEFTDDAQRIIAQTKGAHWRIFWCRSCEQRFVGSHVSRARRCDECSKLYERAADADRKRSKRRQSAKPRASTCPCGADLYAAHGSRRYCSPACRQTAYRMRKVTL